MKLSDFDYELPSGCIAARPAEPRDSARLLAHDVARDVGEHARVADLERLLAPGDLLVVNDTRVRSARLCGRRQSGGAVELLVLARDSDGAWRALVRPASKLRAGDELALEGGRVLARAVSRSARTGAHPGEWRVELSDPTGEIADPELLLERFGRMPLPPYLRRPRGADPDRELDREAYQTVYARQLGAVAAPTAGLHFTRELLLRLDARGIERTSLTLHVGEGTFLSIASENVLEHRMHSERYVLPAAAADAIARCRARGGRVVAVGTTSARVLETCASERGLVHASSGETALFLAPGARFRVVDVLLTNFHLPRSTLLVLVSAFAGRERILRLYREAIERGYRFYSYGDAMLLVGERALR